MANVVVTSSRPVVNSARFWLDYVWERVVYSSPIWQRTLRQKSSTSYSLQWN